MRRTHVKKCPIERAMCGRRFTAYPTIRFEAGDRVTLNAGGCVQTAGGANVLVAPDFEPGDMLTSSVTVLEDADAGIVLGARVPIILTSRADGS